MMLRVVVGVLALLATGAAQAGSYEDFAAGLSALGRDEPDKAIPLLSRALGSGDLPEKLRPGGYVSRGRAYFDTGQFDRAVSDATAALSAKPDLIEAYELRAKALSRLARFDEALGDLAAALRLQPSHQGLYRARGLIHWERGQFAEAAEDFDAALRLFPTGTHFLIWRMISAGRSGPLDPEAIRQAARPLRLHDWPGPIVKLFLGRWTAEEVFGAVARKVESGKPSVGLACEADFYVGEWHLVANRRDEAERLIRRAAEQCPRGHFEGWAAATELRRIAMPAAASTQ